MKKTLLSIICIAALLTACVAGAAVAYGAQSCTLRVEYPYMGTNFELHAVADKGPGGSYVKKAHFASVPVELNADSIYDPAAADTLAGYVRLWEMEALAVQTVGWDNSALFEGLQPGLYLLLSHNYTESGKTYAARPVLVSLPMDSPEGNGLLYEVTVAPKPGEVPTESDKITLKLLKVWEDAARPNIRPPYITVYLFCDSELYDTVRLSAAENWRWQWDELEANHVWSVVEDVVKDYSVLVEQQGITFVVTNTALPETGPDDTDDPDEPEPTPTPTPVPPYPWFPVYPGYPGLPQTGQLWWPVPLLAAGGLVLFVLGWRLGRRSEED